MVNIRVQQKRIYMNKSSLVQPTIWAQGVSKVDHQTSKALRKAIPTCKLRSTILTNVEVLVWKASVGARRLQGPAQGNHYSNTHTQRWLSGGCQYLKKPLVKTNLLLKLILQNRNDCQCLGIGTSLIVINLLTLFYEIVCQYYNAGWFTIKV